MEGGKEKKVEKRMKHVNNNDKTQDEIIQQNHNNVNNNIKCTFHLPISIEEMKSRYDVGIFFEFKHYKPKKKYNSTRCWTFFELDEIINGEIRCEWYKKPIDVIRKRIQLHTIKNLFLHLDLKIRQVE